MAAMLSNLATLSTPSAVSDLGLGGSMDPDEEDERRRKMMASAQQGGSFGQGGSPLGDLGLTTAATTLLGSRNRSGS